MFSKNHHSHWWSLLILALVAFAYLIALARPAALSSSGPVYRAAAAGDGGRGEGAGQFFRASAIRIRASSNAQRDVAEGL